MSSVVVTEIAEVPTKSGQGTYLKLTKADGKTLNIFDSEHRKEVEAKGPGTYEVEYEKKGNYWNVKAIKQTTPALGGALKVNGKAPAARAVDPSAMHISSCVNGAAVIAAAMVQAGSFFKAGDDDKMSSEDQVVVTARNLVVALLHGTKAADILAERPKPVEVKKPEPAKEELEEGLPF